MIKMVRLRKVVNALGNVADVHVRASLGGRNGGPGGTLGFISQVHRVRFCDPSQKQ